MEDLSTRLDVNVIQARLLFSRFFDFGGNLVSKQGICYFDSDQVFKAEFNLLLAN